MTTQTASPTPALARCTVKGCRHIRRVDIARSGSTGDRFGNIRPVSITRDHLAATVDGACPDHGAVTIRVTPIKGTATDHTCDDRCMSARGPVCECACGGSNHGAAHV